MEFKKLHQKFIDAKQVHTVAVLMKDLWENHSLFYYLATAPYLEIGLHGWEHKDYSKLSEFECWNDIDKSINYWEKNASRMTGKPAKKINTFFAPWNNESKEIKKACSKRNINFCNVKGGEWNGYWIKSFHYWSVTDNFKI
jgi:peptidoglycan/xylan/chitin deacetylase (PgdA/CDA1 family)